MNNLGLLHDTLDRYEKAEEYYKMAIDNGYIDASVNLALMYQYLNRYEEAEKYFKIAIDNGNIKAKEYLKDLPKLLKKIYTNINEDNCIICLDKLMNTEKSILIIPCGHSYHMECYNKINKCSLCGI